MISFVIPAQNESALIGRTVAAVRESARQLAEPSEVIVVDDASTDGTGEIARGCGAQVVPVHFRRIAATRNAGGRAAAGELLFFVDADTMVTAPVVRAAVGALRAGAVLVPPEGNVGPMEAAFKKSGDPDVTITVLPGANHRFEVAGTGARDFGTTGKSVSGYYDVMAEWIKKRTGSGR